MGAFVAKALCGTPPSFTLWDMSDKVVSETSLMMLQHSCPIISQPHLAGLGPKIAVTCLPWSSALAFLHLGTGGWWWGKVKSQLMGLISVPQFSAGREYIVRTTKLPSDVGSTSVSREKRCWGGRSAGPGKSQFYSWGLVRCQEVLI